VESVRKELMIGTKEEKKVEKGRFGREMQDLKQFTVSS
jgi:hypothetical protein